MADYEIIGIRKQQLYQLKSGFDIFGITSVIIMLLFIIYAAFYPYLLLKSKCIYNFSHRI